MRLGTVLAAAVVLTACAGPGGGEEPDPDPGGSMVGELASSMEVEVTDGAVRFILHVTNTGSGPLEMVFPTSQRHDVVVRTESGEEVWRWSAGRGFAQAITRETLAPGDSWDLEARWTPGDRTGTYVATGLLLAREHEVRQQSAFEL